MGIIHRSDEAQFPALVLTGFTKPTQEYGIAKLSGQVPSWPPNRSASLVQRASAS